MLRQAALVKHNETEPVAAESIRRPRTNRKISTVETNQVVFGVASRPAVLRRRSRSASGPTFAGTILRAGIRGKP